MTWPHPGSGWTPRTVQDRLWDWVAGPWVEGVEWDDCWLFTGAWRSKEGYGRIGGTGRGARAHQAHVVSFEQFWGPLAPEHEVRHACVVVNCVNPWHLAPGTHQDNTDDKYDPEFAWACTALGGPPRWWVPIGGTNARVQSDSRG